MQKKKKKKKKKIVGWTIVKKKNNIHIASFSLVTEAVLSLSIVSLL